MSNIRQRSMPHVVTQWQAEGSRTQHSSELYNSESRLSRPLHLVPHQTHDGGLHSPSLRVPDASSMERWENDYNASTEHYAGPESPLSSGGSMLESMSEDAVESPNSSIQSDYVAELEDTSFPLPQKASRPQNITANTWPRRNRAPTIEAPDQQFKAVSPDTMEFRTAQMTVRFPC